MARPKFLINRETIVTNVSSEFKKHLHKISKDYSKEAGKPVTLSELVRGALLALFPMEERKKSDFNDKNQLKFPNIDLNKD